MSELRNSSEPQDHLCEVNWVQAGHVHSTWKKSFNFFKKSEVFLRCEGNARVHILECGSVRDPLTGTIGLPGGRSKSS